MSFKEFCKELNGTRVEGELIKSFIYSLATALLVLGILYYFVFSNISDFISRYSLYVILSTLSICILVPTIRQVRAYGKFACMSGMMIGMTVGMIAGFLIGFYLGATNGMFFGGVSGMIIGILIGIWLGSCCGVMGFMEGIMAGFMGGWMGAMTSVMLLNDHLRAAAVIVFIVQAIISISLNYMIYVEAKHEQRRVVEDEFLNLAITFVLVTLVSLMIVIGPRGGVYI
jgi:hypothetical protein